jgi:uncharacterized surface protein with fasciclin (FAS1) repeats
MGSAPRQSWCTMLFKFCFGTAGAKQAVSTQRSTSTEASVDAVNQPKEQAIDREKKTEDSVDQPKEQAIDREKNTEDWVEEVSALAQQPSDDVATAVCSDNVSDVDAPIVKETVPSTLGEDVTTTDEEIGILAMFKDINERFPNLYTAPAQAYMNAAFADLFRTYTQTVKSVGEQEITRDLTETDEEYGMTAMFRELGEQFPDMSLTNPDEYINAMCAQLLRVYYTTALKASTVPAILECNADVVELDEDVGPHAMMKEVAGQFPGLSAFEAQQYMLCRFTELSSEAEKRRAEF